MAVILAAGAVLAAVAFAWMVRMERTGRSALVVTMLVALTLVESVLFSDFSSVPSGLFHPGVGGLSFRLPDVAIPLALAARFVARGGVRRVSRAGLAWTAFFVFLVGSAAIGVLQGNQASEALFQAKALIYIGGGMALAAGVPARDQLGRHGLRRRAVPFGVLAAVLALTTSGPIRTGVNIPGVGATVVGGLHADAAAVFVAIGAMVLAVELCRRPRSSIVTIACLPLLFSAFETGQRASILLLAAVVVTLSALLAGATGRLRARVTATEVVLSGALALGAVVVLILGQATAEDAPPRIPLAGPIATTFVSEGKIQSAEARRGLWREALSLAESHPVFGWGLGKKWVYFKPGPNEFATGSAAHNIALDLLVRMGVVGIALFLLAVALSIAGGVRAWRLHPDPHIAALAAGATAALVGLLAKGMVESIFENYRVAVVLGVVLGIARSAARDTEMVADHAPQSVSA